MISVILSTFNRERRVKKAIQSVLNQSYPDFELIVVDDCSTDGTQKAVESFKDKRIRYIKLEKNSGSDTRPKNKGILAAQGEYIAFLDDDNEFRPDHLAVLHNVITKDERIDVVYGDRWLVDETNTIEPQIGMSSDFKSDLLIQRNFIDASDVLLKKSALFEIGGFDETCKKYVDWNVWVRLMKNGKKFLRVPMVLTDYHLHKGSKSFRVHTKGDAQNVFIPEWSPHDCDVVLPYLGKEIKEPKVAIFTITYDRLEYTKKSFKSLEKTADYPYDHFVVDNGSTDGTRNFLVDYIPSDRRLIHGSNQGISAASNQAVDMIKAKGDYDIIVKWDNDCIGLTKGWLSKMVELWKATRMIALSCYVQGLVDNPGGAPRVAYGTLRKELIGLTKHLGGICHFVDAHAYDEFRWDEHSFLHGVQDMEFSQWLLFHGYTMGYLENYFVSHGPMGTSKQKDDYPLYFERRKKEKQTRYEGDGK